MKSPASLEISQPFPSVITGATIAMVLDCGDPKVCKVDSKGNRYWIVQPGNVLAMRDGVCYEVASPEDRRCTDLEMVDIVAGGVAAEYALNAICGGFFVNKVGRKPYLDPSQQKELLALGYVDDLGLTTQLAVEWRL
jgi:hypothetical protein